MIRKIFKSFAIAGAFLVIAAPVGALLYRAYRQHGVAEERAIRSLHGINSLECVPIGGIGQWIEVRGENVDNPILLWIHGGPGVAFIPLAGRSRAHWRNSSPWRNGISAGRGRPMRQTTRNFKARR